MDVDGRWMVVVVDGWRTGWPPTFIHCDCLLMSPHAHARRRLSYC